MEFPNEEIEFLPPLEGSMEMEPLTQESHGK